MPAFVPDIVIHVTSEKTSEMEPGFWSCHADGLDGSHFDCLDHPQSRTRE